MHFLSPKSAKQGGIGNAFSFGKVSKTGRMAVTLLVNLFFAIRRILEREKIRK